MKDEIHPVSRRFIEDFGRMTQSIGAGRVLGQLYAYLYFSQEPRTLGDMQKGLGISKGSASMAVRQLEQWGGVRRVWVHGDRKDYYEANDWFGQIVRNVLLDRIGTSLASSARLIEDARDELAKKNGSETAAFIRGRVGQLEAFQAKAHRLWNSPILKRFLQ